MTQPVTSSGAGGGGRASGTKGSLSPPAWGGTSGAMGSPGTPSAGAGRGSGRRCGRSDAPSCARSTAPPPTAVPRIKMSRGFVFMMPAPQPKYPRSFPKVASSVLHRGGVHKTRPPPNWPPSQPGFWSHSQSACRAHVRTEGSRAWSRRRSRVVRASGFSHRRRELAAW